MEFNPEPDTPIRAGDKLVVLGRPRVAASSLEVHAARRALMAARVLDGTAVASQIRARGRAPRWRRSRARAGRPPGLGIVLVGDDPASEIYVRQQAEVGGRDGLRADLERLPATASLDRAARRWSSG